MKGNLENVSGSKNTPKLEREIKIELEADISYLAQNKGFRRAVTQAFEQDPVTPRVYWHGWGWIQFTQQGDVWLGQIADWNLVTSTLEEVCDVVNGRCREMQGDAL